jgi:phage repressor protein C with HTH and peptisase S24 domain
LEISGESMEPVFRDGDIVIVSPEANIRRGDRVIVKTRDGEVLAKILLRLSALKVDLESMNKDHEDRSLPIEDVEWVARIIWASQ